jgi:hypothetical protein
MITARAPSSPRFHAGRFMPGLLVVAATVATALASGWVVSTVDNNRARDEAAPVAQARPARIPACHEAGDATRTCRTRTALLTTSAGGAPLRLQNIEVSLLGTHARRTAGGGLDVEARVAVRNLLTRPAGVNPSGHQLYLSVGGRIFWSRKQAGQPALGAGATSQHRLRFTLPAATAARIRRAGGRADLGIRPFRGATARGPRQIGVMHLRLQRPGSTS